MKRTRLFVLVLASLSLAACAQSPPEESISAKAPVPTLLPGEIIDIQVYGQQQLSGTQMIDDDGNVSLLLAGHVHVAGLQPTQIEKAIRDRLSRGLIVNPSVSVTVTSYLPIYVVGEVAKPGAFLWRSDMRVLDTVALAGGYTYRAATTKLAIRPQEDPNRGGVVVTEATRVQPGDVVVVPERKY